MPISTAMIFAAGLGTRMRPITDEIPKPLVPVNDREIIDYAIEKLLLHGVNNIIINCHHKAEYMVEYVETLQALNPEVQFTLIYEKILLDTGGGVVNALPYIGEEPFFIINGDIIWLENKTSLLQGLEALYDAATMDILLALCSRDDAVGYDGNGDFKFDPSNNTISMSGKPPYPYVYMGVGILHPRAVEGVDLGVFSLGELFHEQRRMAHIKAYIHQEGWLHIGTVDGIKRAEEVIGNSDD